MRDWPSSPTSPSSAGSWRPCPRWGLGCLKNRPVLHHAVRRRGPAGEAGHRAGPALHGKTIYILDEPTTGLHTYDVHKLLEVLDRLVEGGQHRGGHRTQFDVIKWADHVIDLGPKGAAVAATWCAPAPPEEVAQCEASYTGRYLKKLLLK